MKLNLDLERVELLVKGQATLGPSFLVQNICSLESATEFDVVVLFEPEDGSPFPQLEKKTIENSSAGLFIAKQEVVTGKRYLLVPDPLQALTQLVAYAEQQLYLHVKSPEIQGNYFISPDANIAQGVTIGAGAVIEAGAEIGAGTTIGAQCFIGKQVVIGQAVVLHPGVRILDRCSVGDETIIHAGSVIGSDGFGYRISKQGLRKIPQIGVVIIGCMVELGAGVMIDRAAFDATIIGDAVKIDNGVHIAHNVMIGAGTAILAQTGIAGSVRIGRGCQIGGQVAIKDHVIIGDGAKIVSKSAVMRNLEAGEVVCGIPAMPFFEWKRVSVAITKLPEFLKRAATLQSVVESYNKKSSWFGWMQKK